MNEYKILSEILYRLHRFEYNNECIINLRHGGNVHTDNLCLECSFKNDVGKKENIRRILDSSSMKSSKPGILQVIDNELEEIEFYINERRNTEIINLSRLVSMANKRDWMGRCMIVKHADGSFSIRCHDTPSYYGDGIEPDPDDFWSLYCTIVDGVITDTWALSDEYCGRKVIFDKKYGYYRED